jgi:hypothetical protein
VGKKREKDLDDFGPMWPEVDDLCVETVLLVVNGKSAGFKTPKYNEQAAALAPAFAPLVERALDPAARLSDDAFAPLIETVRERAPPQLGLDTYQGRERLAYRRPLNDVGVVLSWGVLLLVEQHRPYREALCRCANCKQVYQARRKPGGGPANRKYCSIACRDKAHSAGREVRRARAARKHK